MPDQNQNSENTLEVVVKAIDGEALVLETPNGDLIHWPLNQIPKSLSLGKVLSIKLESMDQSEVEENKKNAESQKIKGHLTTVRDISLEARETSSQKSSDASKKISSLSSASSKEKSLSTIQNPDSTSTSEDSKHARMRKMLENIING
jgi:hypothetical protein